ncbi:7-carboxy-7-deazaguanine synthase QueE [Marinicella sp. W31]|uniref:7-carboxy-7-deazaguanine synthase QueE n=1 Tax=Marinicella sp. W31 TaxID=3023713 RepID=UPI0037568F72
MSTERHDQLKIFEIFHSLQGESTYSGLPTVFVRLTGCPLRCTWCDTEYAFHGGQWMHFDAIEAEIAQHGTPYVCITGGEPLSQKRVFALMDRLVAAGYHLSLETSGAITIENVNSEVIKVVDMKAPGSGEEKRNDYSNFQWLNPQDQVKFVIQDRQDYDWSKTLIEEHQLQDKAQLLFSPVADVMPAKQLADWILADQLPVRFQIQLHKQLWGNTPGT